MTLQERGCGSDVILQDHSPAHSTISGKKSCRGKSEQKFSSFEAGVKMLLWTQGIGAALSTGYLGPRSLEGKSVLSGGLLSSHLFIALADQKRT